MILKNRIPRMLREKRLQYILLFLLIVVGLSVVIGGASGNDNILRTNSKYHRINHLESGEFTMEKRISADNLEELEKNGSRVERQFYKDVEVESLSAGKEKNASENSDSASESGGSSGSAKEESVSGSTTGEKEPDTSEETGGAESRSNAASDAAGDNENSITLRIFANREYINRVQLDSGALATSDDEIVVEKHFAEKHELSVGDTIALDGSAFRITGIGSTGDYNYVKKNVTDLTSDPSSFSTAFVTSDAFDSLQGSVKYHYAYILGRGERDSEIRDAAAKTGTMTEFVTQDQNSRITAYEDDCGIMRNSSMVSGAIFMLLVSFIIAVFLSGIIEREEPVIGCLYALGIRKSELLRHYMLLPVCVVLAGSVLGVAVGTVAVSDLLASDSVQLYSMPELEHSLQPYILVYGIVMPLAVTVLVNAIILNRTLSRKPVDLLRRQHHRTGGGVGKFRRAPFFTVFRIRQFFSEIRGNLVIFVGILLASLLLVLGFTIESSMKIYIDHVTDDIGYKYQYVLNSMPNEIPEGSEPVYDRMFTVTEDGTDYDITMEGIRRNSEYYPFDADTGSDGVYISDAVAKKLGYEEGDLICLTDHLDGDKYYLKVLRIVPFNYGLCVFMDIDEMRELLDSEVSVDNIGFSELLTSYLQKDYEGYYNVLVSNRALDLPDRYVASVTTARDIVRSAEALTSNMEMMMLVMDFMGLIVFAIVVFLLSRLMIERSANSISLIKVFGYRPGEIIRVYLGSTFFVVLAACAVSLPVSAHVIGGLYPYITRALPAYFDGTLPGSQYGFFAAYMLAVYILVNIFLMRQLRKVPASEVLKNRE